MQIFLKKTDGKVEVFDRSLFEANLSKLKDGEYYLVLETKKKNRSLRQNRYMWGVAYKIVADYTGYTPEECHQIFKQKFLSYDKSNHSFLKSTKKLSTKEFEIYIESVRRYAAEKLGLNIPDPAQ